MSENKTVKRVELDEENLDVAGGRFTLAEAMGEAQLEKMEGKEGNFLKIWLKSLFKNDGANSNDPLQKNFESIVDSFEGKQGRDL